MESKFRSEKLHFTNPNLDLKPSINPPVEEYPKVTIAADKITDRIITAEKKVAQITKENNPYDNLTGLRKKDVFESDMDILWQQRDLKGITVFTDYVNFKTINDVLGHEEANNYLKKYGEIINSACRTGDSTWRWGGDEAVIFLKNADKKGFNFFKKRLIHNCQIQSEQLLFPVIISIGHSVFNIDNYSLKELSLNQKKDYFEKSINSSIKTADDDMYKHKIRQRRENHLIFINRLELMKQKSENSNELNRIQAAISKLQAEIKEQTLEQK